MKKIIKILGIILVFATFFTYTNRWFYPDEVSSLWILFSFWKWIFFSGIILILISGSIQRYEKV